jgi:hypothetical protein
MQARMACSAKCDQIFFAIVAGVAAELFVMNFQVGHRSAELASPAIAAQHLVPELLVQNGVQPQPRTLMQNPIHDAF